MKNTDVQKLCRPIGLLLTVLMLLSNTALAADKERNLAVKQVNNAVSEQRIALVIGNGAYTISPLKNPVNDAKDMANKLRSLGFDVIERNNLQTRQIGATLREFRSKLVPGAVALVFYAGHGLQIKGDNYLPAVDAEINSEEDVPNQSLAVKQIMDVLDESKTRLNLVFLDACRNNPYARSFRSADRGLARISAPSGTLISYATRPGSVAADGGGRNGLYTSKLLAQMDSNLQIEQTLKRVVTEVKAASQGKQEPWMEGSIEGDFCFAGCNTGVPAQGTTAQPSPAVVDPAALELDAWNTAREMNTEDAYQAYLTDYADGRHAKFAQAAINKLKAVQQPAQIAMHPPGTMQSEVEAEMKPGKVFRDCPDCPEMVVVPAGSFTMGSPSSESGRNTDENQRQVTITQNFAAGKFEVTFDEWDACVTAGGCNGYRPFDGYIQGEGWGRGRRPVINVNWDDAKQYLKWLTQMTGKSYRLLTEAEWEYAARAGTNTVYSFSNNESQLGQYAWNFGSGYFSGGNNSNGFTHPVGEKKANGFNLYDMHGNVGEWVEDCYEGNCGWHVVRGGSCGDNPKAMRSASRTKFVTDLRHSYIGFRIARHFSF